MDDKVRALRRSKLQEEQQASVVTCPENVETDGQRLELDLKGRRDKNWNGDNTAAKTDSDDTSTKQSDWENGNVSKPDPCENMERFANEHETPVLKLEESTRIVSQECVTIITPECLNIQFKSLGDNSGGNARENKTSTVFEAENQTHDKELATKDREDIRVVNIETNCTKFEETSLGDVKNKTSPPRGAVKVTREEVWRFMKERNLSKQFLTTKLLF